MAKVVSINISEKKGVVKVPVQCAELKINHGIVGDAHAGNWHRQISLLAVEAVRAFEEKYNFKVPAGAFGENLLVEGIDLKNLPIGTRLKVNDILLEITQIGKKCHLGCNIQKQTGECIMPNEGVFAIVLNGGEIKAQDTIFVEA